MSKTINTIFTSLEKALDDNKEYSKQEIMDLFKKITEKKEKKRRAKNSYQFYLGDSEVRGSIKKENPNASNQDILKSMASKWKTLEESDKEKYEEMAIEDKKNYPTIVKQKERTRAKTPYQFYMGDTESRDAIIRMYSEADNKEILGHMASKWKDMKDTEKEKYEALAIEDKKFFTKTPFELFKEGCSDSEDAESEWEALSDTEKEKYDKTKVNKSKAKKITKQPKSPLKIFQADKQVREDMKSENPGEKAVGITKLIAAKWKEMSDEEKEPFKEMAKKEKMKHSLISTPCLEKLTLIRSVSNS